MPQNLPLKSQTPTTKLALSICLGTLVSAYISVCLTQLAPCYRLRNALSLQDFVWQITVATSAFNFGSIVGPVWYRFWEGFVEGRLGLRGILVGVDVGCIAVLLWMLIQLDFVRLVIGRIILGILIGISTSLVPRYIRLMSPLQIAGKMGTFNQLLQTIGVLFSCLLGFLVMGCQTDDQLYWRIYLGFPLVALGARIWILLWVFPYEIGEIGSLKEYVAKVYEDQAEGLAQLLANNTKIQAKQQSKASKRTFKKRFLIGVLLMASNQVTGINAIVLYLKQLTHKIVGSAGVLPQLVMILIAATQVFATVLATGSIERQGRKKMLLTGQLHIILVLLSIFAVSKLSPLFPEPLSTSLTLLLILLHLIIHNRGLGSLCIIYCSDILQDLSWMIAALKICSFLVALTSEYMIEYLGIASMFFIFALMSMGLHFLLRLWVIETKDKAKEEIYRIFDQEKDKGV